ARVDGVLLPLELPDLLPLAATTEPRGLEAVTGREGDGLVLDELRNQLGEIHVHAAGIQSRGLHELLAPANPVRQTRRRHQLALGPQLPRLQAVQEPAPERLLLEHLPRRPVPAAL